MNNDYTRLDNLQIIQASSIQFGEEERTQITLPGYTTDENDNAQATSSFGCIFILSVPLLILVIFAAGC